MFRFTFQRQRRVFATYGSCKQVMSLSHVLLFLIAAIVFLFFIFWYQFTAHRGVSLFVNKLSICSASRRQLANASETYTQRAMYARKPYLDSWTKPRQNRGRKSRRKRDQSIMCAYKNLRSQRDVKNTLISWWMIAVYWQAETERRVTAFSPNRFLYSRFYGRIWPVYLS